MKTEKRLIDANVVLGRLKSNIILGTTEQAFLRNYVNSCPTVDAVEVVRCKDCVYCSTKRASRYNQLLRFCEWGDGYERVQSDGMFFCDNGKRRTE